MNEDYQKLCTTGYLLKDEKKVDCVRDGKKKNSDGWKKPTGRNVRR